MQDIASCNNDAQGSHRVSSGGTGPNGVALQAAPYSQINLGLMATSLEAQSRRTRRKT